MNLQAVDGFEVEVPSAHRDVRHAGGEVTLIVKSQHHRIQSKTTVCIYCIVVAIESHEHQDVQRENQ